MKKRASIWGLAAFASVGCVCAAASTTQPAEAENVDWCAAATADQIATWGANTPSIQVEGNATKHANCEGFIVDVSVSAATGTAKGYLPQVTFSAIAPQFELTGGPKTVVNGLGEQLCSSWQERTLVYKKAAGETTFRNVAGGWSHGVWGSVVFGLSSCGVTPDKGYVPIPRFDPPTGTGTDVYRIVYSATRKPALGAPPLPVSAGKVTGAHPIVPPG